jgi:hypothetical protein
MRFSCREGAQARLTVAAVASVAEAGVIALTLRAPLRSRPPACAGLTTSGT